MSKFHLSILTPSGNVYENDIESLVAPGANGSFGVLADHAPLLSATIPGILKVKGETEELFAVGIGVVEINKDGVNFLVDKAVRVDSAEDAQSKLNQIERN